MFSLLKYVCRIFKGLLGRKIQFLKLIVILCHTQHKSKICEYILKRFLLCHIFFLFQNIYADKIKYLSDRKIKPFKENPDSEIFADSDCD